MLVNVQSKSFANRAPVEFELFKKYQTIVHRDPPEHMDDYIEFLCASPLEVSAVYVFVSLMLRLVLHIAPRLSFPLSPRRSRMV